jgi:hypothetical protein
MDGESEPVVVESVEAPYRCLRATASLAAQAAWLIRDAELVRVVALDMSVRQYTKGGWED